MKKTLKWIQTIITILFNVYVFYLLVLGIIFTIHHFSIAVITLVLLLAIILIMSLNLFLQEKELKKLRNKLTEKGILKDLNI